MAASTYWFSLCVIWSRAQRFPLWMDVGNRNGMIISLSVYLYGSEVVQPVVLPLAEYLGT